MHYVIISNGTVCLAQSVENWICNPWRFIYDILMVIRLSPLILSNCVREVSFLRSDWLLPRELKLLTPMKVYSSRTKDNLNTIDN